MSMQKDSSGIERPYITFTIAIDRADGGGVTDGILDYQCQMRLIDSTVSHNNAISVVYNGYSICESPGYLPDTFAEYFTKISELHSQIAADGGKFVAGTSGDPHNGFEIILVPTEGKQPVTMTCDFMPSTRWTVFHVTSISDPTRPGESSIGGDGYFVFNQVIDIKTFLVNRQALLTDASLFCESDQVVLSYLGIAKQAGNLLEFHIPYELHVSQYDIGGSVQTGVPVTLNLDGHMTVYDGKIYLYSSDGETCSAIDRLSIVATLVKDLKDPEKTILVSREGLPLVYINLGSGNEPQIAFTALLNTQMSSYPVAGDFTLGLISGSTLLWDFVFPEQSMFTQTFRNSIDLGIYPNVRAGLALALQELAIPGITIEGSKRMSIGDSVFYLRILVDNGGFENGKWVDNMEVLLLINFNPESNTPGIDTVNYRLGYARGRYVTTYTITDPAISVNFQDTDGNSYALYFSQWLTVNHIDLAKLTDLEQYNYFTSFLLGQVTPEWDPEMLSQIQ
ncbi:MAG TPA: hypothetical protein VKM55_04880 [Candidatus Lokiarchaeia archaeon]|nr:hypothetical protein [Candidatus Lokiarchaeia archaeon]